MVITFGLNCDSARETSASLDSPWVGVQQMLSLLEAQLGLPADQASYTDRLVQYLECLERGLAGKPFYAKSFEVAPLHTAATLLEWRDQLYMGGWNGHSVPGASPRLKTLIDIEKAAASLIADNVGQRLQRVISVLTSQNVRVSEIHLRDTLELLPPLLQQLLCILRDHHGVILKEEVELTPAADAGSDLGRLQRRLIEPEATGQMTLTGDGSLVMIQAPSVQVASYSLAQLISAYQEITDTLPETAILAEHSGRAIDAACESQALPRPGFSNLSPWRPAAQVQQLAFELMWDPLDPQAQLEFLTHPVGPLPRKLKARLAQEVAEHPGIGSERWQQIIASAVEALAEESPEKAVRLQENIQQWLEPIRYNPETGMPLDIAQARAELVFAWLQHRHSAEVKETGQEHTHFALALRQVSDLINALGRLGRSGKTNIGREELRLLIGQSRGAGIDLIDRAAETIAPSNPLQALETPSAISGAPELVVWMGLAPVADLKRAPWLPAEVKALADAGVVLWSQECELALQGNHWLRPLMRASKQLLLLPYADCEGHHPVLDLIAANLKGGLGSLAPLAATEVLLGAKAVQLLDVPISADACLIPALPLPKKQRWWQLQDVELPKREAESFTSLDQFINSPYQWVFRYGAQLKPGALAELQDERRLKGNLAHMLFEQFFTEHTDIPAIDCSAVEDWCQKSLYALLPLSGSTMLLPGHRAERERFLMQCAGALAQLCEQLQAASVVKVAMESPQSGDFIGGQLRGSIDLLATNVDGHEAVIDIKWSGYKYRKQSWEEGNYLQLVTYAHLRRQITGRIPALAYFTVSERQLLSNSVEYFPKAQLVADVDNLAIAEYWKQLEDTWKWRREQLGMGRVEVTVSGTEPTEESQPDTGVDIPETSDTFNDYAALTGWEENA
ncbi:PD-(D/E)XK nuclease family protein [Microbulbifer bruguierae]|uniref:PD-(D/E)XK nuclease family protein n=1 Tax=Microbulbifer bruguierae TaxID=3029061 RepID=A0ABY8NBH7_9GAMM|nr:PD-(D/E)XK nuclease family protein [Microbulbifer bruguierae]WGL16268.1 PD-(D/E)XK nuclease family protein [Microbulbifer bruguierae]